MLWSNKPGHFLKFFFKFYRCHITDRCMNTLRVIVPNLLWFNKTGYLVKVVKLLKSEVKDEIVG